MANPFAPGPTARPWLARIAIATVSLAVATAIVGVMPATLRLTSGVLVYLIAVLAVSVLAGRAAGVAASIGAFAVFDLLFVEPRLSFTINEPSEWVALLTFLVVALVTSQLAAGQRERVRDAEAREQEARLLHDLADLLAWRSFGDALDAVSERVRQELGAESVTIELTSAGPPRGRAPSRPLHGPVSVLGEGTSASAGGSGSPGRWLRVLPAYRHAATLPRNVALVPIRADDDVLGEMRVKWTAAPTVGQRQARLLDTVAGQLAVAAERERLRARALDAEVLRRTSDLKSALLDAVSHDLRTPLSSIIGASGSMLQEDVEWTAAERREFLETIEGEAGRLNRIVGNLLDLSRIQGGSLVPARDWHDPALLMREALHRLEPLTRDHRVMVDVPHDLPPVLVDPVEVDQVIANLVENAVKYTPPGAEIRVTARVANGELRVSVEDDGPGIPPSALPRLFEPFYRGPGAAAGRGSGVGLAVAHGIVTAHGGHIWAQNADGHGARFTFTIPSGSIEREPEP